MKYIVIPLVVFTFFSCKEKEDKYKTLTRTLLKDDFKFEAWRLDSLGCYQSFRIQQANILNKNKKLFEGLRLDSIVRLLGNPFVVIKSSETISYEYIVEGKDYCCQTNQYIKTQLNTFNGRRSLDMYKLRIAFGKEDSVVLNLTTALP